MKKKNIVVSDARGKSMVLQRFTDFLGGGPPVPDIIRVPDGHIVYAIGDIHGQYEELIALQKRILRDLDSASSDGKSVSIVYLGDYIDRGPDSSAVVDAMLSPLASDIGHICLLGNHEAAMLDFMADPLAHAEWLDWGGLETLASYGLRLGGGRGRDAVLALADGLRQCLPEAHRQFLENLIPMVEIGDYAFVHAGVRPGRPLAEQTRDDLLWIRDVFLSSRRWHGRMIVHGHTIVSAPQFHRNRIAIDTGAYATGLLSCLRLEGEERRIL